MTRLFWTLVGGTKPPLDGDRRKKFRVAFQDLWVPSALGTLLFVLARSISAESRAWPPDPVYTLDRFVRYGYLLWLTSYFFVAGVENKNPRNSEQPKWPDIWYDIMQYVLAFTAAVFMGFIVPDIHYDRGGYVVANVAIVVICGLALWLFGREAYPGVNRLRKIGLIVSVVATAVVLTSSWGLLQLIACGSLQFVLWVVLFAYIRIRLDTPA